jgi:hypothetical protein
MAPPPRWKQNVAHPKANRGRWALLPQKDSMSCGPTCVAMALAWQTGQRLPPITVTKAAKASGGYKLSTSDRIGAQKVLPEHNETIGGVMNAVDLDAVARSFAQEYERVVRLQTYQATAYWPSRQALRQVLTQVNKKPSSGKMNLSVVCGLVDPGPYIALHSRQTRIGKKTVWYFADPDDGAFLAAHIYSLRWNQLHPDVQDALNGYDSNPPQTTPPHNQEYPHIQAWVPGANGWRPDEPVVYRYDTIIGESALVGYRLR